MNSVIQSLTERKSVRVYTDREISEELREMFAERMGARTYEDWMKAFCDRKYNSGFSREMSRSVRTFLRDFEEE